VRRSDLLFWGGKVFARKMRYAEARPHVIRIALASLVLI
jgi:hypothetical protein